MSLTDPYDNFDEIKKRIKRLSARTEDLKTRAVEYEKREVDWAIKEHRSWTPPASGFRCLAPDGNDWKIVDRYRSILEKYDPAAEISKITVLNEELEEMVVSIGRSLKDLVLQVKEELYKMPDPPVKALEIYDESLKPFQDAQKSFQDVTMTVRAVRREADLHIAAAAAAAASE